MICPLERLSVELTLLQWVSVPNMCYLVVGIYIIMIQCRCRGRGEATCITLTMFQIVDDLQVEPLDLRNWYIVRRFGCKFLANRKHDIVTIISYDWRRTNHGWHV